MERAPTPRPPRHFPITSCCHIVEDVIWMMMPAMYMRHQRVIGFLRPNLLAAGPASRAPKRPPTAS